MGSHVGVGRTAGRDWLTGGPSDSGLGLQDDGRMEVPPGAVPAGWYTGAPTPRELGPAILAGHVDYGGKAGVFHRLGELGPGDTVEVTREDGTTAMFRVTRVEQHRKDAFPTAAVYGDTDHAGLRLITCGGAFDRRLQSYEHNVVVFARHEDTSTAEAHRHSTEENLTSMSKSGQDAVLGVTMRHGFERWKVLHGQTSDGHGEGLTAYQTLESLRSPHVTGTARRLLLLRLEVLVAIGEAPEPLPLQSSARRSRTDTP